MSYNPTQLDHLKILSLLSKGLISYLERVRAGETEPFPYPDALLRGFNQLGIACALQGVERALPPQEHSGVCKGMGDTTFIGVALEARDKGLSVYG